MKAELGPNHPTRSSMNSLARAYYDAGKLDLALPLLEETLKLMKAELGPEHPARSRLCTTLPGRIMLPGSWNWPCRSMRDSEAPKAKLGPNIPTR